ncbi:MAG: hypothetical protein WAV16_01820 [Candidatus Moraniibacteriota bacterium]
MSDANKILFKKNAVSSKKQILEILRDPQISKIVDNHREQRELVTQFKKYNKGGITKKEVKTILGDFYYNKNDSLDKNEVGVLAKKFGLKGAHKYIRPAREQATDLLKKSNVVRRSGWENSPKKETTTRSSWITPSTAIGRTTGYSQMGRLH